MFSTKRCVSAVCSDDATGRSGRAKSTSRQRAVERTRDRGLKRSFQATLLPQVVRCEAAALFFAARCPIAANCASRVPKKIAQSTKTQPQHGAMHMKQVSVYLSSVQLQFLGSKRTPNQNWLPPLVVEVLPGAQERCSRRLLPQSRLWRQVPHRGPWPTLPFLV